MKLLHQKYQITKKICSPANENLQQEKKNQQEFLYLLIPIIKSEQYIFMTTKENLANYNNLVQKVPLAKQLVRTTQCFPLYIDCLKRTKHKKSKNKF